MTYEVIAALQFEQAWHFKIGADARGIEGGVHLPAPSIVAGDVRDTPGHGVFATAFHPSSNVLNTRLPSGKASAILGAAITLILWPMPLQSSTMSIQLKSMTLSRHVQAWKA